MVEPNLKPTRDEDSNKASRLSVSGVTKDAEAVTGGHMEFSGPTRSNSDVKGEGAGGPMVLNPTGPTPVATQEEGPSRLKRECCN